MNAALPPLPPGPPSLEARLDALAKHSATAREAKARILELEKQVESLQTDERFDELLDELSDAYLDLQDVESRIREASVEAYLRGDTALCEALEVPARQIATALQLLVPLTGPISRCAS